MECEGTGEECPTEAECGEGEDCAEDEENPGAALDGGRLLQAGDDEADETEELEEPQGSVECAEGEECPNEAGEIQTDQET